MDKQESTEEEQGETMTQEPVGFRVGERMFFSLYSAGVYASEMKLTIYPLYLRAVNSPEIPDGWLSCDEWMPNDKDYVWC